jgi:hypothetical protein
MTLESFTTKRRDAVGITLFNFLMCWLVIYITSLNIVPMFVTLMFGYMIMTFFSMAVIINTQGRSIAEREIINDEIL